MISSIGILKHRIVDSGPPVTGGVLQIGTTGNMSLGQPINYADNYGMCAYIFTTAELGAAKTITSIEVFFRSWSTPLSYSNQVLKMGLVTQSAFANPPVMTFTDLTLTNYTTVKSAFTQSISSNGIWYLINLTTPFVYDGVKNLLLVWENNMGSWMSQTGGTDSMVATNSVAKKSAATYPITGTGTVSSNRPVIKIHY